MGHAVHFLASTGLFPAMYLKPHISLGRQWFRQITLLFMLCILRTALKTWKHSCVLIRKGCCSWVHQEVFNPPHHCSLMSGCWMYHTCFLDSSGLTINAEACMELAVKSGKHAKGCRRLVSELATSSTSHSCERPCAARIPPSQCLVPSESKGKSKDLPSPPHTHEPPTIPVTTIKMPASICTCK